MVAFLAKGDERLGIQDTSPKASSLRAVHGHATKVIIKANTYGGYSVRQSRFEIYLYLTHLICLKSL